MAPETIPRSSTLGTHKVNLSYLQNMPLVTETTPKEKQKRLQKSFFRENKIEKISMFPYKKS